VAIAVIIAPKSTMRITTLAITILNPSWKPWYGDTYYWLPCLLDVRLQLQLVSRAVYIYEFRNCPSIPISQQRITFTRAFSGKDIKAVHN
jgi:hypothetical protein